MKVSVRITGTEAVRRMLEQIGRAPALKALAKTAEDLEQYAAEQASTHNKTGAIVRSTYLRRVSGGWEIGHDPQVAPHALFVHWGTRPHKIRPSRKKILRWPAGGKFIFAREVNHPGYKGDPWLVRAAQQAPAIFERHVSEQLARITASRG